MTAETEKTKKSKKYKPRRPFPIHPLEDALKVAKAIQEKNAGKPWKPIFVAEALEISPNSTNFRDLTSSSYKYGLTEGTWNAKQISLTALGHSITRPTDSKKEVKDLQEAVLNIQVFKTVFEHYKDSKFPKNRQYDDFMTRLFPRESQKTLGFIYFSFLFSTFVFLLD